jgi:uncharacterized membrane protein
MPEDERLEAISEALARLLRRQDERQQEIDARFARIEAALGIHAAPPPVVSTPPPIPPPLPASVPYQPPPMPMATPRSQPPPPPPVAPLPQPGLEARIGLNWINIIGVVTLLFGAAFFFKYAVDNNWVGPGARVALGIVSALIALFFGDLMWRRGQKVFGQGITGLGLALLYLSFWASFGVYHLVPQPAAFMLMVLTTVASVVFAMRYESQVIAVLGMMAGYWTPGALSSGDPHPWILFSYVFLLNLGGLALTHLRRWKALEIISGLATIFWYGAWMGFDANTSNDSQVATVFAFAFYAQFCFARARLLWSAGQLLGPVAILNVWNQPEQFLPLLFLYAAGGLVVAEVRRWTEAPAWTLTCYWGAYFFWTATMKRSGSAPELPFAYITGAFILFFFWIIWWAVIRKRVLRNTDLLVMAVNAAAYFGASYYLLNPNYHAYMGLFAALLGALNLLLARLVWNPEAAKERDSWPALLAVAVTLTFLTLAVPIQFAGFRITIAWALEGAALAWISARFKSTRMSVGASIVLVLALMRLYTVDTVFYAAQKDFPLFVNERFLTFAVSAIGLFIAAKFFLERALALISYVSGHFVTLTALGFELVAWVQKSIAQADQFQTTTVSISILMAFYALMLITLGVATKSSINRILGLLLIALCVVKLYLSDVWELGFLFRIVAFLGLGVLLLTVSYLYSRFRPVIEKLWKDDPSV